MFQVYAVDPKAISANWKDAKYLIEKFGLDQGRLISKFPNKWLKEVYDGANNWHPIEKKKLEEKLAQVKAVIFSVKKRSFDPKKGDWISQALEQHKLVPFHAIIVEEKPVQYNPAILVVSDIEENLNKFQVDKSPKIPRVGTEIASALEELLGSANVLQFIDPYFDVFERKYKETLRECLKFVQIDRVDNICCEIHRDLKKSKVDIENELRKDPKLLVGVIPEGLFVRVYSWIEKSEVFHARYLLTDLGGVSIDAGFSAEGKSQSVPFQLLQSHKSQEYRKDFNISADTYKLIRPILKIRSNGKIEIED